MIHRKAFQTAAMFVGLLACAGFAQGSGHVLIRFKSGTAPEGIAEFARERKKQGHILEMEPVGEGRYLAGIGDAPPVDEILISLRSDPIVEEAALAEENPRPDVPGSGADRFIQAIPMETPERGRLFDGSSARPEAALSALVPPAGGWSPPASHLQPGAGQPEPGVSPESGLGQATQAARLAEKAVLSEGQTEAVLTPLGLVGTSSDAAIWTGIYTAAEAYRYASTRDPEALRSMERALGGLHALHEATGVPGLIARNIECGQGLTPSESNYTHAGVGRYEGCVWKGRLSFDQYLGYLYGISEAWPHIQDPELRKRIQEDVRQIARHFVANGGRIQGLDTDLHSSQHNWYQHKLPWWLRWLAPLAYVLPTRGGNVMHGLHLMKVASYVTEDPDISAYYHDMVARRQYHRIVEENTQGRTERLVRGNLWWINMLAKLLYGFDVKATADSLRAPVALNLGHIAAYNLARLESDPGIRRSYLNGLQGVHEAVAGHANTYWNFLYASQWGEGPGVQDGIDSLERFPAAGRGPISGSADPAIGKYQGLQCNFFKTDPAWKWFAEDPLPFEKRALHSFAWQHNALEMDGGAFETRTAGGSAYLVAYWLGRSLGFIAGE